MNPTAKVGLFFVVGLVVLGWLVLRIEEIPLFEGDSRTVDALFDSVQGLDDKAAIRVAGVRVGRVDGVRLDGGRARVTLRLDEPVELFADARAKVANAGLLGEKLVELDPGTAAAGPLPEGAVLEGEVPVSFDDALAKLDDLGSSIQGLTGDIAGDGALKRLIANLEATSADVRSLISAHREQIGATIGHFESAGSTLATELPKLSEQLGALLSRVDAVVAENRDELSGSLENIEKLTADIQVSVDNVNRISGQLASGEGTLGKLIYDDAAHDSLVSTLDSVESGVGKLGETFDRINRIDLELGMESAWFADSEDTRSAVRLQIDRPETPRFYRIELVDDPQGRIETKTETFEVVSEDGTVETTTLRTTTVDDDFEISAQLGYRWGETTFRAGLFESSGGAGVDWDPGERFGLTFEAFDFSRPEDLSPRLRILGRWKPTRHVTLYGGWDDPLESDRDSLFLGAGIRWRDPDLKYLLGSVPSF